MCACVSVCETRKREKKSRFSVVENFSTSNRIEANIVVRYRCCCFFLAHIRIIIDCMAAAFLFHAILEISQNQNPIHNSVYAPQHNMKNESSNRAKEACTLRFLILRAHSVIWPWVVVCSRIAIFQCDFNFLFHSILLHWLNWMHIAHTDQIVDDWKAAAGKSQIFDEHTQKWIFNILISSFPAFQFY